MNHPYGELRIAVAKHENCNYEILKNLVKNRSRTLRRIVREITTSSKKLTDNQKRDILITLEIK